MEKRSIIEVLTIPQTAKRYAETGLTESAIRRLAKTGEIPSRRIGVKYLIPTESLEAWLRGDKVKHDNQEEANIRRVKV